MRKLILVLLEDYEAYIDFVSSLEMSISFFHSPTTELFSPSYRLAYVFLLAPPLTAWPRLGRRFTAEPLCCDVQ